jgi:hypothetical protein
MFAALDRVVPLVLERQDHGHRASDGTALLLGTWRETAGATDPLLGLVLAVALAGLVIFC